MLPCPCEVSYRPLCQPYNSATCAHTKGYALAQTSRSVYMLPSLPPLTAQALTVNDFFGLAGGIATLAFAVVIVMIFVYEYDVRRREKS